MNGPGDLPLQRYSGTPEGTDNCGIISIIPTLGMSSCRGRAEAFARRLSSKLRTLGSQGDESDHSTEEESIINGESTNTWVTGHEGEQTVTDLQPLRHESDSYFDFDCESPGSPVDECEYLRLIESTSNTPHNSAAESGYACASAASSHSSSDGPYFDVNSESDTSQNQKAHICQNGTEGDINGHGSDVVDFHKSPKNDDNSTQCNGHDSGFFTPLSKENSTSPTTSESQNIYNNVKKSLPSEGPDIKVDRHGNLVVLTKENSMTTAIQEEILQELRKQSKDFSQVQEENKKNLETAEAEVGKEATEAIVNENEETLNTVIHTIINGHAENGEDVLKIEVCEIKETCKESNECSPQQLPMTEETKGPQSEGQLEEVADTKKQLLHTSHLDTDDEDDCRPQRVRRCSSLKTGKTPPGTPGRKKIVRFADVLGLDLADIKTFLDEVPTIPKSAYEDLEIMDSEPPIQLGPKSDRLLMPLFQQPGALPSFLDIVREKLVSLENAAVTDTINQTITGTVRVRNIDFHKSVHIRYTTDSWRSFADLQANYVENTCDGFSDKFSFVLFGNSLHVGQRLEFAIRYSCKGQQYWDNNYGSNYCFQCLPTTTPAVPTPVIPSHHTNNLVGVLSPTAGETWCSSFY
ncbi:glycogen binding subunit 76A [Haematobia irritans]|uniref:glycogen binding subunit 76A n=1 Tax=Haematobia irritans TaxID=7368 RepID=UPI003F50C089